MSVAAKKPPIDEVAGAPAARTEGQAASLYIVAAHVPRRETLGVGALGAVGLERGWYAYVGSARRGRAARVARHMRADKPLRWHADYLFGRHAASRAWLVDVPATALAQPAECALVAGLLGAEPRARRASPRFGASDCGCAGHLLWFPSGAALGRAVARIVHSGLAERAARVGPADPAARRRSNGRALSETAAPSQERRRRP